MKAHEQLIEGLQNLKRGEIKAGEYYRAAAAQARERKEPEMEEAYLSIRSIHGQFALHFQHRREELEKEGLIGDTVHAFVDALRSFVRDMPVLFFENETPMTPDSLIKLENDLIKQYEKLLEVADEKTSEILQDAIRASKNIIEHVAGLQTT